MSTSSDSDDSVRVEVPPGRIRPDFEQREAFLGVMSALRGEPAGPAPVDADEVLMVPLRRGEIAVLTRATWGRHDPVLPDVAVIRQLGLDLAHRVALLDRDGLSPEDAVAGSSRARAVGEQDETWVRG
jgi:hypothetical protein